MASVASKNLYELLGNTSDEDPDKPVPPPVQPIDKPVARTGKRNGPAENPREPVPTAGRGGRGGRRDNTTGNERAFRDRDAGRANNAAKPVDDGIRDDRHSRRDGGELGQRGGRGARRGGEGPRRGGDRHSRMIGAGTQDRHKQAEKGWGDDTAIGELKDEQAGQQIAIEEEKQGFDTVVDKPVNADGEHPVTDQEVVEPEPEDKTKSYAAYLAEQAEKKLSLGGVLSARKANEGASKKLPEGKAISRDDENTDYFAGSGGKAKRERERKEKNTLLLDHDIQAREREASSRGRGGGRGRGRGEGGFRGEGRGRGGAGRARGEGRGGFAPRGGRGGPSVNLADQSAFPSLGA